MSEPAKLPDFAPVDPTDGRELLEWRSRYPKDAKKSLRSEAIYLASLLFLTPLLMVILWLEYPKHNLSLSDEKYESLLRYSLAWLGGVLGGTLFDLKWLYHSVARQIWHLDRRLWRVFTPHISGGLAFAVIALISSGMFRILDRQATESRALVVGVAFMVGYFSDSAIAKLAEIADTLFGVTRAKEKHKEGVTQSLSDSTENQDSVTVNDSRGGMAPSSSEVVPMKDEPSSPT